MVTPLMTPGRESGIDDLPESDEHGGAQVLGRLDDVLVDLAHHIVDGQDHKRQVVIDHPDEDGSPSYT